MVVRSWDYIASHHRENNPFIQLLVHLMTRFFGLVSLRTPRKGTLRQHSETPSHASLKVDTSVVARNHVRRSHLSQFICSDLMNLDTRSSFKLQLVSITVSSRKLKFYIISASPSWLIYL